MRAEASPTPHNRKLWVWLCAMGLLAVAHWHAAAIPAIHPDQFDRMAAEVERTPAWRHGYVSQRPALHTSCGACPPPPTQHQFASVPYSKNAIAVVINKRQPLLPLSPRLERILRILAGRPIGADGFPERVTHEELRQLIGESEDKILTKSARSTT